jgi:hypothetical protein
MDGDFEFLADAQLARVAKCIDLHQLIVGNLGRRETM